MLSRKVDECTVQLNLSCFCPSYTETTQRIPLKVLTMRGKVDEGKPLPRCHLGEQRRHHALSPPQGRTPE